MRTHLRIIIAICFLFNVYVSPQSNSDSKNKTIEKSLSYQEYNSIINQLFSKLITGQSSNTIGGFASLEISEPQLTFSSNYICDNGNIITAKIKGGISDGIYEIFNNSKLNTNVSLDIQIHLIDRNCKRQITYNTAEYKNITNKLNELENNFSKDTLLLFSKQEINLAILEKNELKKLIKDLESKWNDCNIDSIRKKLNNNVTDLTQNLNNINNLLDSLLCNKNKFTTDCCKYNRCKDLNQKKDDLLKEMGILKDKIALLNSPDTKETINTKRDSLSYEIKLAELKQKIVADKIKTMQEEAWESRKYLQLRNKLSADIEEEGYKNLKVRGFTIGWLSFGYKVQKDKFKLFSVASLLNEQIQDKSFVSHEFRIQYSYFCLSPFANKTYFLTGGLSYSYRNNLSDLAKIEIEDVVQYGQDTINRTSKDNFAAYTGNYKEGFNEFNINVDAYYFLFTDNQAAIHLFPDSRISNKQKPISNLGIGIVFSFADMEKKGAVLNAELYYRMKDIFNVIGNDFQVFERNSVGLRFTFPINFNMN